jgi:hypothetical protein
MTIVPAIIVSDHGHGGVADLGFTGKLGFLQVGHADDIGAPAAIEIRLGTSGELRAFNADVDSARFCYDPRGLGAPLYGLRDGGADWIAKGYVAYDSLSEKGGETQGGAVDELIGDYEFGRFMFELERAYRGDGDDPFDAQLLHGEDVGAEIQVGGEDMMASAMASQEGYLAALQFTGHKDVRRIAKWGGYLKVLRIAQTGHCVKPAPAYDSYFRLLQTGSEGWGSMSI